MKFTKSRSIFTISNIFTFLASSSMVEIIYYGYPEAPNPCKVMHTLQLFRIPHRYCKIPMYALFLPSHSCLSIAYMEQYCRTMPRPDFASIDITYRRSPLLSIDSE